MRYGHSYEMMLILLLFFLNLIIIMRTVNMMMVNGNCVSYTIFKFIVFYFIIAKRLEKTKEYAICINRYQQ